MTKKLRIVLAQLNLLVGDIDGNLQKHIQSAIIARDQFAADIIVFSELSLTGYPPEDLLLRKAFIKEANKALKIFMEKINDIHCIVGHPYESKQGLQNACSLIYQGNILGQYAKQCLPNYGVFDETRYFVPGDASCIVSIHDIPIGLVICEDLWQATPTQQAAKAGARIILAPNASPFEINKHEQRLSILSKRTIDTNLPIVYVNQIGGQDELIFDGGSMIIDINGKISQFAGFFKEVLLPVDIDITASHVHISPSLVNFPTLNERIYESLVLAVRDYVNKNRFPGVLIGLSGGIDSALTLSIAVDALGKERVQAIMMPSRHTSDISLEDAKSLAQTLEVIYQVISIEPTYQALIDTLTPFFADKTSDVTEENIQARCRAIILMALSNKLGSLILTTGNRSEMAVGYCTLYGDLAGGFAVLKNIPKTLVYQLANYRNSVSSIIPARVITRPPTAELAPNQRDEDSLPPYHLLDAILDGYLNHDQSVQDLIEQGFNKELVMKVIRLIHQNEYKRRQSPIGPHINLKSFGKDWRYPITNGYKE